MVNRRGFLGLLAGAIGGMSLDPERVLWLPGKKLISIPMPQPFHFGDPFLAGALDEFHFRMWPFDEFTMRMWREFDFIRNLRIETAVYCAPPSTVRLHSADQFHSVAS